MADQTRPHPAPSRVLRFVAEHPVLAGWYCLLAVIAAWDVHRNGPGALAIWLLVAALIAAQEWLYHRLGTGLDRSTAAELIRAVSAQPYEAPLVDRETGDVLAIRYRRLLGTRSWTVHRFNGGHRAADEAMGDFADGYQVSTIPVTTYVVRPRQIMALDDAIVVRPGEDGDPEPDLTQAGNRLTLRSLWFRARSGATRVAPADVAALVAQLRRAEPIQPEPEEDEHVAA